MSQWGRIGQGKMVCTLLFQANSRVSGTFTAPEKEGYRSRSNPLETLRRPGGWTSSCGENDERLCTPRVAATIATSSSEDNEGPDEEWKVKYPLNGENVPTGYMPQPSEPYSLRGSVHIYDMFETHAPVLQVRGPESLRHWQTKIVHRDMITKTNTSQGYSPSHFPITYNLQAAPRDSDPLTVFVTLQSLKNDLFSEMCNHSWKKCVLAIAFKLSEF
ncbi:hypothetical protein V8E55_011609 [Tylopilus felleus]